MPDKLEVEVDTSDFVLPEPEWRLSKMAMSSTHEVNARGREHSTLRCRAIALVMVFTPPCAAAERNPETLDAQPWQYVRQLPSPSYGPC